jgi:hypothetical protein
MTFEDVTLQSTDLDQPGALWNHHTASPGKAYRAFLTVDLKEV